jgi:heterodisulfide reductase subunit B
MRTLISSLTKENELLQRQVDNVRRENNRLKTTCDQLRGKMLAEKMLKKLLDEEGMERFDEDIDFEDDEDENELLWKQKHDIN